MTPSTTPYSITDTSAAQDTLTVAELAVMLRIHPVTVRLHAAQGLIPGRQIGNRWRFSRARIEEWLAQAA
jgi:excisionase family DNA binding protein